MSQIFSIHYRSFPLSGSRSGKFYSLPQLEKEGVAPISQLPVSIRIVLESVLRNCDGKRITEDDVRTLAKWAPNAERTEEIPFVVARILFRISPVCRCWLISRRCVRPSRAWERIHK